MGENHDGAGKETGGAHAGNGAADDEGDRGRGDGAQQAADFKDENGREKGPLDVEETVDDAVHGLQTGGREEIGGSIPALTKKTVLVSEREREEECFVKEKNKD